MLMLVKVIGIVISAMGIIVFLSPNALKRMIAFWGQGKRIYLAGVLRLLFGVILLLAASQCRQSMVVLVLGILMLIGGLLIFVLRREKIKSILNWWENKPKALLRLWGIVALAIGALLIYSV